MDQVGLASALRSYAKLFAERSGLAVDSGEPALGIGIAGMRERVKQLEGEFLISRSLGIGTTIQVVLPLTHKEGTE